MFRQKDGFLKLETSVCRTNKCGTFVLIILITITFSEKLVVITFYKLFGGLNENLLK